MANSGLLSSRIPLTEIEDSPIRLLGGAAMDKELMLVGSVPLETPDEVFRTCGQAIGHHVPALPDGETDERIWWVNMLAYRVFHGHPEIRTVKRPPPEN